MEKHEIAIQKFIDEMGYKENEHVLGAFFYGSYLTGLYHDKSDIDMHIIFDDSNPYHLIRGNKWVNGFRVEYFEKPIEDLYLSVNNDFEKRNVAWKAIIGTSKILFDKNDQLKLLQEYTFNKYSNPLPKLSLNEALAEVYILSNRIQKLEMYVQTSQFVHLYHLTIEYIMRFYHDYSGLARFNTTKIYKMYTNEEYRKSYNGFEIPEKEFVEMYLDTICDCYNSNEVLLEKLKELYYYVIKDISLSDKDNQLKYIKEYILSKYNNPVAKLSSDEARERVSILNNRMEKLAMYVYSPQFVHLYHLTIEKIMKFYHDFCGLARISTTKVYKMYTDEKTKKSYKIPENEFIDRYLNTICDCYSPNEDKLEKIKALYEYARRDISLGEDYRIPIKSRNLSQ